ncbi:MAG: cytochrome c oxidase accessory protein CcoG [Burkholderiaceae bacterium]|jgi:cytochrome c oxidase accessory protein FixG
MTSPGGASTPPPVVEQTVLLYAPGKKIYARAVDGLFNRWRWAFVFFTQALYYLTPWVTWNGRPAVLFDLEARRFYILDLVLVPQDFIYLTALLLLSAFGLFLFTAIAGRLFCGYACPQTVYTEIFMQVERWIEGDRHVRIRADHEKSLPSRLPKKFLKWMAWAMIALWTGFTFAGYFTPIHELAAGVMALSLGFWQWFWMLFYSFFTMLQAGFMREQVCKYMCPYARFQSAMFDRDTLIVSYDTDRGEPRGKRSKAADHHAQGKGDCIDCGVCVEVCPTGIDIRDGLQYECIGCGLCADACNTIMDRMDYPRGLVRYATLNALEHKLTPDEVKRRFFRPRVLIYTAVLSVVALVVLSTLAMRVPLNVNVIRDRGALAREIEGTYIENTYRLQITNTGHAAHRFVISPSGLDGLQIQGDTHVVVEGGANTMAIINLQLPLDKAEALTKGSHKIALDVRSEDNPSLRVQEKAAFYVPR